MLRWFIPLLAMLAVVRPAFAGNVEDGCVPPGAWVDTATGARAGHPGLLARAAGQGVVLRGESHDSAEHHRWQLQTIAGLHALVADIVLGFEMFPRRVQPALDRGVAGGLDEAAFLDEAGWDEVWGVDAALYMPLFHFARINRVPMVALNVDRGLVARVREEGWAAIPEADREGVSDPAPASAAYIDWLREVYRRHLEERGNAPDSAAPVDRDDPAFRRFVEAQLTWDRAMAEALAAAADAPRRPLVIGVIGEGHLRNRFGVPWQLAALGAGDAAVLLPWDAGRDCAELTPDLADAVFGLAPPAARPEPPKPRLGVIIRGGDGGVRVIEVVAESVAEAAGIRKGDLIVEAAGVAVADNAGLIAVVQRQAPGTWLPLAVERGGERLDIVARFAPGP